MELLPEKYTSEVGIIIPVFHSLNNIIPIKKQSILKTDCFFISVFCSLFYFSIFNTDRITLIKMKFKYAIEPRPVFFYLKTKIEFTLTFKKTLI